MKKLILGLGLLISSTVVFADEQLFMKLDTDSDGLISIQEAATDAEVSANFAELDSNKDGYLSPSEFAEL